MPWNNTIRKGVMRVIDRKIRESEKKYQDGLVELEKQLEVDKTALETRLVDEIIGKII